MFSIDRRIRETSSLFWLAIAQLIYGIIETTDTITILLISAGLVPNLYIGLIDSNQTIAIILDNTPILLFPIFLFFTTLRLISGYWILRNKVKGIWLTLFLTGITLIAAFYLLPLGVLDIGFCIPIVYLLFTGYFGDRRILESQENNLR